MKSLLSLIIVLLLSACTNGQDMQKYLSDTKQMVKDRNYKEALDRYIWFHDHALEYNQAMSGVRLSFALADWNALGKVYPPATAAMVQIRDKKTKQVIDSGSSSLFSDVEAINRTLGENDKTIQLFETVTKAHPDEAKIDWMYAKDVLFKAKRYDIIQQYVGNPVREFATVEGMYQTTSAAYSMMKMPSTVAMAKSYNENSFVEKSIQLMEFAIWMGDIKSAQEIKEKAMAVVEDYRLKNFVISK
jgi:hypothetical protein